MNNLNSTDQALISKIESFLNQSENLVIIGNITVEIQNIIQMVSDCDRQQKIKPSKASNLKVSRPKGRKQGHSIRFDQPKKPRHLNLIDMATKWLDSIASEHQIKRSEVIELWSRNQITVSAPVPSPQAIDAVQQNPHATQQNRRGYSFGEHNKVATNIHLTDSATEWLDSIANESKINRSDLLNLWAIGYLPPPKTQQTKQGGAIDYEN